MSISISDWEQAVFLSIREAAIPKKLLITQATVFRMDNTFRSYIFKEREDLEVLEERKTLLGWIVVLLAIFFFVVELYAIGLSLLILVFIASYGVAFSRWNKREPLNGSLPISFSLNVHELVLAEKKYSLQETRITRLTCDDFRDMPVSGGSFFFARYPARSNGAGNHIWFVHQGKEYRLRFLIESKQHLEQIENLKRELKL